MYLALAVSAAGFPQGCRSSRYSRSETRKRFNFQLQGYYLLWHRFPAVSFKKTFCNFPSKLRLCLTTPTHYAMLRASQIIADKTQINAENFRINQRLIRTYPQCTKRSVVRRFGLLPFRSPLLGEYWLVSVPPGTEMFHFPGCTSCD